MRVADKIAMFKKSTHMPACMLLRCHSSRPRDPSIHSSTSWPSTKLRSNELQGRDQLAAKIVQGLSAEDLPALQAAAAVAHAPHLQAALAKRTAAQPALSATDSGRLASEPLQSVASTASQHQKVEELFPEDEFEDSEDDPVVDEFSKRLDQNWSSCLSSILKPEAAAARSASKCGAQGSDAENAGSAAQPSTPSQPDIAAKLASSSGEVTTPSGASAANGFEAHGRQGQLEHASSNASDKPSWARAKQRKRKPAPCVPANGVIAADGSVSAGLPGAASSAAAASDHSAPTAGVETGACDSGAAADAAPPDGAAAAAVQPTPSFGAGAHTEVSTSSAAKDQAAGAAEPAPQPALLQPAPAPTPMPPPTAASAPRARVMRTSTAASSSSASSAHAKTAAAINQAMSSPDWPYYGDLLGPDPAGGSPANVQSRAATLAQYLLSAAPSITAGRSGLTLDCIAQALPAVTCSSGLLSPSCSTPASSDMLGPRAAPAMLTDVLQRYPTLNIPNDLRVSAGQDTSQARCAVCSSALGHAVLLQAGATCWHVIWRPSMVRASASRSPCVPPCPAARLDTR